MTDKKAIFAYLVLRLNEKTDQVGKTTIQKMIYFLKKMGLVEYEYTLYHYGPYSFEVESEVEQLESSGVLSISWNPDRGYFIRLAEGYSVTELEEGVRGVIDSLVEKFGHKKAKELSLIATVLHFYGRLPEDRIIEVVKSLKPQFSEAEIRDALVVVKEGF